MDNVKAFLGTPVGKFLIDLAEGAIYGAAVAALALPDSVTAKEAIGLIAGGAVGGLKAIARVAITAFVTSRKPA